jgi:uncharacterized protein
MDDPRPTRMFPLGSVLFPYGIMPLHVFEPRYLQMVEEALGSDKEFGIVLIERGFEVGGGDQRFTMGTRARILETAELEGDRLVVLVAGTGRLRVEHWLPDDPYPVAITSDVDEPPAADEDAVRFFDLDRKLRRYLALYSELGGDVGALDFELDPDPTTATFQACGLAGLTPIDSQRLLEAETTTERIALLDTYLDEETFVLERRLAGS